MGEQERLPSTRRPDSGPRGRVSGRLPGGPVGPLTSGWLDRPFRPDDVVTLQHAAGNRAVADWLGRPDAVLPVQRQPAPRVLPPRTQRWAKEEAYQGEARLHRTTAIEASSWAEVGPAPPRISYRREVELWTRDGISVYLDIRGTVRLDPGTALPTDEAGALAMRGREVLSQRTLRIDGGDVIPVSEYSPDLLGRASFGSAAEAVLPDYAQLPLSVAQQEAAILAHLRRVPRRPRAVEKADDERSAVGVAADVATDFLPLIGELKDLYRAVTGRDPVTGEKLAWWERALAWLGAIPLVGKLSKMVGKGLKFLAKPFRWLGAKGAAFAGWVAEKFSGWLQSRKAKKLAKAQTEARRLAAAKEEIQRLAEARRLASTIAPTLPEVQKLVPSGTTWLHWGVDIFGQGPGDALARIGTRSAQDMLALGVNRDVAQALYNWYRGMKTGVGLETRLNRMRLLEHIISLF